MSTYGFKDVSTGEMLIPEGVSLDLAREMLENHDLMLWAHILIVSGVFSVSFDGCPVIADFEKIASWLGRHGDVAVIVDEWGRMCE